MVGGVCGGGHAWWGGVHGREACVVGGVHGGGACMAGGMHRMHTPPTVRDTVGQCAGGAHPAGMHSCCKGRL